MIITTKDFGNTQIAHEAGEKIVTILPNGGCVIKPLKRNAYDITGTFGAVGIFYNRGVADEIRVFVKLVPEELDEAELTYNIVLPADEDLVDYIPCADFNYILRLCRESSIVYLDTDDFNDNDDDDDTDDTDCLLSRIVI
jgi:hypothetical protein